MVKTSKKWKENIKNDNRDFTVQIETTLADGTTFVMNKADIVQDSFKIDAGTSESGKFCIGSAVIGKLSFSINNIYNKFSKYSFAGAKFVPYVGYEYEDGATELIRKGTFSVYEKPRYNGSIIQLSCLDSLENTDRQFTGTISFPITRGELARMACVQSGVTLLTSAFSGFDKQVEKFDYATITCREILSYIAQLGCLYVTALPSGSIALKWYDIEAYKTDTNIDGGDFIGIAEEDSADGGNFKTYIEATDYNGGMYCDLDNMFVINSSASSEVDTDDVIVTGIRIKFSYTDESGGGTGATEIDYLYGVDGYVLVIENNPLLTVSNYQGIAAEVYDCIAGVRFRPLNVSALSDPATEAGDWGYYNDDIGNSYKFFLTNHAFVLGGYETYICDAESPAERINGQYNVVTKTEQGMNQTIQVERLERELAIEELNRTISNSSGTYTTIETKPDGSNIYYMHDKKTMEDSTIVWKMTAEAWAVSTDGGETYSYGMEVNGNVIVNILSAIGVNADWINAGTITGRTISGSTIIGSKFIGATGNFSGEINALSGSIGEFLISGGGIFSKEGVTVIGEDSLITTTLSVNGTASSGSLVTAGTASVGILSSSGLVYASGGSPCFYSVNPASGSGNAFTGTSWANGVITFNKGLTFQIASSSDQRLKKEIKALSDVGEFYLSLKPKLYRFKVSNEDSKIHAGLLAQEIITALEKSGMDALECNIIEQYDIRDESDEGIYIPKGDKPYRVNYENLHAYHIAFGQEIYAIIEEQSKRLDEQGKIIEDLKLEIEEIKGKSETSRCE